MTRKLILVLFLSMVCMASFAQVTKLSGLVMDKETGDGVMQATVQLLKSDSSFVVGTVSDANGNFVLSTQVKGRYILKFTSIGYKPVARTVRLGEKNIDLGSVEMSSDAIMLKGTIVEGHAAKVVVKEDTFQYNASAYKLPEGSVIEELVKKLPGAEVGDDGTIKINGKEVKKILVDGKEFMTGDTKTAMKNIPTSIIEKVKAYDQQSDLARVTGIDDGEEQTVLDFGVKRGMNQGMFSNVDLGYGTKNRYVAKGMGAYFNDKMRVMVFAGANNNNDRGFGGGGRFGGGSQGLNASKMLGANFNYEEKNKLKFDASLRWNHSDGDLSTSVASENFVATAASFSNSLSQKFSRSNSWDARMHLEWTPDSATTITFRPTVRLTKTDGQTVSSKASYSDDPYAYVADPLENEAIKEMESRGLMVNTNRNISVTYGNNESLGAMLQWNRRLSNSGRNITVRADVDYSNNKSNSLSVQNVHLYQVQNILGGDSTYQTNRYNLVPAKNWSYALQTTYSEPLIARELFLQFSYRYKYSLSESDRSTYDFSNLGESFFEGVVPAYRGWDSYLSLLANPLENYLDDDLSRYSKYETYTHDAQVMLRWNKKKYRLNVGVMAQPMRTHYTQDYLGAHVDTVRNVVNWSPTFDFRYRLDKRNNLRINYRGSTSQPSMGQLLSIVDDSDPLNISVGNPGLKPSFTNRFRLFYNGSRQSHMQSWMAYVNYSNTRNDISNRVTYDERTGGRTTRPDNINGNWNLSSALMFNTSIDSAGVWNINTFTNFNYNNYVGYLQLNRNADSQKNVTRSTTVGERMSLGYNKGWFSIELDGQGNYTHTVNKLQPASNMNTWQFTYGSNVTVTFPWNMSLSTDIHEQSRRGYSDASLNTNELLWNAQISQSFLRGNALTVSFQWNDILAQQSNFTRAINATMRSDTQYNSITSYGMLRVTYKFNAFGGKNARPQGNGQGHFGGPGRRPGGVGHSQRSW
jgi:hypothetical protein